jgi:hypothetical protein
VPAQLLPSAHVYVPKSGSLLIKQSDTAVPVHKPIVLLMLDSYGDLRGSRWEASLDELVIWLNGAMHVSSKVEVNEWLLVLISPGHEIWQNGLCWTRLRSLTELAALWLFGCGVCPQLSHQEEDLAWSNATLVVNMQVVEEMIHSTGCLLDKHQARRVSWYYQECQHSVWVPPA